MARHEICPSTMTVQNLADWIRSNKVEVLNHTEKVDLTPEEEIQLQKESSLASRAIDKLDETLQYVKDLIKNGTPWNSGINDHSPISVTIPPTKGTAILEKNRKHADNQLELGYKEEITALYLIPWPEFEKMVAMDIEGKEWTKYSRGMSPDEVQQHRRPVLSAAQKFRDDLAADGMKIDKVGDDGTVHISTGHKKTKEPDLDL
jgi:hypothetical protein